MTQPPGDSNFRPPSPPAIDSEAQASQSLPRTHPGREEESPQALVEVHTPGGLEDQQSESTSTGPHVVAVERPSLTQDQEDVLVDWSRNRPLFYKQRDAEFKKCQKKDWLLAEVGTELGLLGPVDHRFKSMRNMYRKWLGHWNSRQADKSLTLPQVLQVPE